jgi:hypothetical protein
MPQVDLQGLGFRPGVPPYAPGQLPPYGAGLPPGLPPPPLASNPWSAPPPLPPLNSLSKAEDGSLKVKMKRFASRGPPRGRGGGRGGIRQRNAEYLPENSSDNVSDGEDESDDDNNRKKRKPGFKRVDWVWDTTLYTFKLQDTTPAASQTTYNGYSFHVRRTFDVEGKYRTTIIDIKDTHLRDCLQDVIGTVQGVSLVDGTPKVDPNLLFLYLEDFRVHAKQLKKAKPTGDTKEDRKKSRKTNEKKRKQLKVLIKYLDTDYAKVKDSLYPMLDAGLITFELLWALWKPNTLAYSTTYGSTEDPRAFRVEQAQLQSSMMKGEYYYIDSKYFEFDGKKFGYGSFAEEIASFQGARKITSLPCYPLKYHKNEEKLRAQLIERGKKFVELSGVHYKSYTGMAFQKRKKNAVLKFNIQNSRIMIDPGIFRRINPNYYVSPVRPQDIDASDDEADSDTGCAAQSSDEDEPKMVTRLIRKPNGQVVIAQVAKNHMNGRESEKDTLDALPTQTGDTQTTEFTDEEYLIASPLLLGFSFSDKQWLEFSVSGINEIKWNDTAWDSLVLEPATKDLIQALVKSRKYNAAQTIDDVIQGKGKGLVTVLHGPPGTGKTLTAEGISELLQCPLYMASAGELSTDSRYLEQELQKILDICHAWGAILLLDEADVFLEKRNMHDIHRNALVSIFLRQLEYFQGILFLTTNRVETFDEAFQSRIHIALRYDHLDAKAKKAIFRMFLDRVHALGKLKLEDFTEDDLDKLAKNDLNGREIKNVIGSAQDLAVSKGEAMGMRHIRQVLDVHAKFGRDLKGGTGYEDAMRSYF